MLRYLTAGESHGKALVAILDGFPAGIALDARTIDAELARRKSGYGRGKRARFETDNIQILSGVRNGLTIGSPVALMMENADYAAWQAYMDAENADTESRRLTRVRPGHADYAGCKKYGITDARNILERASARETAIRTAIGVVCKEFLAALSVRITSRVVSIGGMRDSRRYAFSEVLANADKSPVRCMDRTATEGMMKLIDGSREKGDTLGGEFEILAEGMRVGIGSHTQRDRRLEYDLMAEIGSIPGVKDVGIGEGFRAASLPGTRMHDEMYLENGQIVRRTNNAGGIEGGISNGEIIRIIGAVKPIPTLLKGLATVDLAAMTPAMSEYERSDICVVPAASVVAESAAAFVLARHILIKTGGDYLEEILARWTKL